MFISCNRMWLNSNLGTPLMKDFHRYEHIQIQQTLRLPVRLVNTILWCCLKEDLLFLEDCYFKCAIMPRIHMDLTTNMLLFSMDRCNKMDFGVTLCIFKRCGFNASLCSFYAQFVLWLSVTDYCLLSITDWYF